MKSFDKYDYLKMKDLERCPYVWGTKECGEWNIQDDRRMLLIALDRYADYLQDGNRRLHKDSTKL
jgi:hypothetical protein